MDSSITKELELGGRTEDMATGVDGAVAAGMTESGDKAGPRIPALVSIFISSLRSVILGLDVEAGNNTRSSVPSGGSQ